MNRVYKFCNICGIGRWWRHDLPCGDLKNGVPCPGTLTEPDATDTKAVATVRE